MRRYSTNSRKPNLFIDFDLIFGPLLKIKYKNMKNNFTLIEVLLMMLVSMSLFSQNYNYLSDYDSQGVPLDMVNTSVSVSLVDNIGASLPEGYPVPEYNPEYI